jgi:hypothetical protein
VTLGAEVRHAAEELRRERAAWREAVVRLYEVLAGRPDAEAQITERTKLLLRGGRVFLVRPGRDPVALEDADEVPGRILVLAAKALRGMMESWTS